MKRRVDEGSMLIAYAGKMCMGDQIGLLVLIRCQWIGLNWITLGCWQC